MLFGGFLLFYAVFIRKSGTIIGSLNEIKKCAIMANRRILTYLKKVYEN